MVAIKFILTVKYIRKLMLFSVFLMALFSVLGFSLETSKPTIVVIRSKDIAPFNQIISGFKEYLRTDAFLIIKDYDLNENENLFNAIESQKPDLILTLGTLASVKASEKIEDIPIVFSAVLAAYKNIPQKKNVTGVSLDIPIETQLANFKRILPLNCKRIGVIYNPEENEKLITAAAQIAEDLGIILKVYPVRSADKFPQLQELGIDALWIIPDTIVCQASIVKRILETSLEYKIPVMGISPSYAKAGALMALACDYEDIGWQTGEIVLQLLNDQRPSSIPFAAPRKTELYLNIAVAELFHIKLSEDIIKNAKEVFGK